MLATLYNAESNLQSKVKIDVTPPLSTNVNPPLRGLKMQVYFQNRSRDYKPDANPSNN